MTGHMWERALEAVLTSPHKGVLAIDPGGTTGLAWIFRGSIEVHTAHVPMGETVDRMDVILSCDVVREEISRRAGDQAIPGHPAIDVVVIEKHIPYGRQIAKSGVDTMELVGKCVHAAHLWGAEVVYQMASQMKTVAWCPYGRGAHERDAAKHLVRYLMDDAGDRGLINLS